jgi:hypothetical protein
MQTRPTPGTVIEGTNSVRETRSGVVLWRPDILVAPGAMLASLGEAHQAGPRHGGESRGRWPWPSATLDLSGAASRANTLLPPPSVPHAHMMLQRG